MNHYIKTLLLLTAVVGLSIADNARADFRDYNHKAWAQAGRSSRSARVSRPNRNRTDRAPAPAIVRTEAEPRAIVQAPNEERRYSYEPGESGERTTVTRGANGCGEVIVTQRAPETARRTTEPERRFSYEPSTGPEVGQSTVRSDPAPRMRVGRPSRSADTPRYLMQKTDPRKYQVGR
jgi:hypothetical protein